MKNNEHYSTLLDLTLRIFIDKTTINWVKGHKDIRGNERADLLSKQASILGHESEGTVTPAGLKAWARRVRAEVRGGGGEGILGWHRKAISAYTWCVTEKGPQRRWLHKIRKKDTPGCHCHLDTDQPPEQSGEHLTEECNLLTGQRELVGEKELSEWKTRHMRNQKIEKKKKGPVGPEKEEEVDKLELFFCHMYEFLNPVPNATSFVPAELPPRYAINFVPAIVSSSPVAAVSVSSSSSSTPPVVSSPAISSSSPSSFSVISSANFVFPVTSSSH